MYYFRITVPFEQMANFVAFMANLESHIETAFIAVNNDATTEWLLRTQYSLDGALHSLSRLGIRSEQFKNSDEADAQLDGAMWVQGLDRS